MEEDGIKDAEKKRVFEGFFNVLPVDAKHVLGTAVGGQQGRRTVVLPSSSKPTLQTEAETSDVSWMSSEGETGDASAQGGKEKLISQKWAVLSEVTLEKEQALRSRKEERPSVNKERVRTPAQVGTGWPRGLRKDVMRDAQERRWSEVKIKKLQTRKNQVQCLVFE